MARVQRVSPLLAVLIAWAAGAGCARFAESVATRYLTRQVDGVFALDDVQEDRVHASIERLLHDLSGVLEPELPHLVRELDRTLALGATEERLLALERRGDALADRVAFRVIDEAVPHALTLTDPQIAHAAAWARGELRERREALRVPAAERLEERQDAFVDSVEDWTGDLSDRQEAAVRSHVAAQPDEEALWLAAGERRVRRIEVVLRSHPDALALRAELRTLWREREELGPGAPSVAERRARGRGTLLFLDGLITPEQRRQARARLVDEHTRLRRFLAVEG